ncbi:MAG: methyltransferase regulatory domain-containing protein [Deltaproteobacteria bacterium]|nr:methyltransferase regulatory domain-containing protein [Deltaproteobacteria bacterium]
MAHNPSSGTAVLDTTDPASFTDPALRTVYDEVPYENHPYRKSHPDALATVGRLFGLDPTPVERARVLELGGGDGSNIIPIAALYPDSSCVGIDLSPQAIGKGLQTIKSLRLSNVLLRQLSITDAGAELGTFDYIICHGIYSWVGPEVRQRILQICKQNLNPNGIAYVSYNCMPGWHFRGLARELMRFHGAKYQEPKLFVHQARAIMKFIAENATERDPVYRTVLAREEKTIQQCPDWHLYHDYLERYNDPVYFADFAALAANAGLQYLGDSEVAKLVPQEFSPEVQQMLGRFSTDIVQLEQYMDFLRNRMFRRTLLVHDSVHISRELNPERIEHFSIACPMKKSSRPGELDRYAHPNGGALQGGVPILNRAVEALIDVFPRALSFDVLFDAAIARLGDSTRLDAQRSALKAGLMKLFLAELCDFRTVNPPIAEKVEPNPKALAYTRQQATSEGFVTNLLHDPVSPTPIQRAVLAQCDGTKALADVVAAVKSIKPQLLPPQLVEPEVRNALAYLHGAALLLS